MVPCPTGMYSLGGASINCTECPAGFACPIASSSPITCTGGIMSYKL